ncbi:MAG: hypothetical protein R6U13_16320 [Desulfatiglandaceae bacterium]
MEKQVEELARQIKELQKKIAEDDQKAQEFILNNLPEKAAKKIVSMWETLMFYLLKGMTFLALLASPIMAVKHLLTGYLVGEMVITEKEIDALDTANQAYEAAKRQENMVKLDIANCELEIQKNLICMFQHDETVSRVNQLLLKDELKDDFNLLGREIQRRLEGPAAESQTACARLNAMGEQAKKSAEEAKKARAALPMAGEKLELWKRSAESCEKASKIWSRLKEIKANIQRWNEMLKDGLTKAEAVATRCRSKEDADKVKKGMEMALLTGEGIFQVTKEAKDLAQRIHDMRVSLANGKAMHEDALEAMDRITELAEGLPAEEILSAAIHAAEAAAKVLCEEGDKLNEEIALLRKNYPPDLKPDIAAKFDDLKFLVQKYQSRGSCDIQAGRRAYNKHAGAVVEIRLAVESLKPFLEKKPTLGDCPTESPLQILSEIIEVKVDSATLLEQAKILLWLADECAEAVDSHQAKVEIRSIKPLISSLADLDFSEHKGVRQASVPTPLKLKAGQDIKLQIEYMVFGMPGEAVSVRIEPSVVGWAHTSGKDLPPLRMSTISGHVRLGENEPQRVERASVSLPMPYPTREEGEEGEENLHRRHDLHFDIKVNGKPAQTIVFVKAFDVEGPGTDFNGTGDLNVCVIDAKDGKSYNGNVRIRLQGPSQHTTEVVSNYKLCSWESGFSFEKIPLGKYRVLAEVVEKGNAYTGPRTGSANVTLFRWNPVDRHVKPGFSVRVTLGAGIMKPAFIAKSDVKPEPEPKVPKQWLIHVKVVGKDEKGLSRARVFTADGAMEAKEKENGEYLLGPIRNVEKVSSRRIGVVADVSFISPLGFSPFINQRTAYVELEEKPDVYVTFEFPITQAPAFIGASGTGEGKTATGSGAWSPSTDSTEPPGGNVGTGSGVAGGGSDESGAQGGGIKKPPEPGTDGGSILRTPRSREECIYLVCPNDCKALLFAETFDPVCQRCIDSNERRIQRCMEGYDDY